MPRVKLLTPFSLLPQVTPISKIGRLTRGVTPGDTCGMSNTPNAPNGPPDDLLEPYRNLKPNLDAFEDPRFSQYSLVRDRIGREPIDFIAEHRLRGVPRTRNGRALTTGGDGTGEQLMTFPSFREIAPKLSDLSGVTISHEAVRRWWYLAWGPEGHPVEQRLGRRRYFGRKNGRTADAPPPAVFLPPPSDVAPMFADPGWSDVA
jgi:hypothetical protein